MNIYSNKIGVNVLSDDQWEHIVAVTAFLHPPHQVMESLVADRKTSLDLVFVSITHLVMPVCTASYMMAGYGRARHIF